MTPRRYTLVFLILIGLMGQHQTYGQAAPGCTTPYYRGNYAPSFDGSVVLQSMTQGPDASVYLGCSDNQYYSIIKLDTFGNMIRSTSYNPSGMATWDPPGKTILDANGNLFSVFYNNYILETDTAGNILWGKQISFSGITQGFNLLDMGMLANGDKVFLYATYDGGYEDEFVVVTSPDASVIRWTKYLPGWTYSNAYGCILADGNKVIVGLVITGSGYYPAGSVIFSLDGGTGTVLQQQWFSQQLTFNHISRYNTGYIFGGQTYAQGAYFSFYIRTDTLLNTIAVKNFPGSPINWPDGFPFVLQAQADGSVYGYYSSSGLMTLFLVSPGDAVEWSSGLNGFYQSPVAMLLNPNGIFIGTDWMATDVVTGGALSAMQIYKTSYSGYFPACTNPSPTSMQMAAYSLPPSSPIFPIQDTIGVSIAAFTIQAVTGSPVYGNTCTGTPSCTAIQITGNPNVCTGTGTFTGVANSGCPLPPTWSVTAGPGTATIQQQSNGTVAINFSQDGAYMIKALVNTNCTNFGDSLLVHVSASAHLSLGDDTTLCAGSSLVLHAGNAFSSYTWQDGSADSTLLVTAPGQYTVTAMDYCGNSHSSSVSVSYYPPPISSLPAGITKCPDDTLNLPIASGFDSVYFVSPPLNARVWQDSIQFFDPVMGNYAIEQRDIHGCSVISTIAVQVYPVPALHIGDDTTICPGDSVSLDAGAGFAGYQWSTGSQSQAIRAAAKGTYWVRTATTNGCIQRDSITLATYPAPVVSLDADTVLCTGTSRTLSAGSGFVSYLWGDGSTAATLTVDTTGQYSVSVTDGQGCSTSDTVAIKAIAPLPANFLPGDTTICQYGSLTLVPVGEFSRFLWSDGSTGATLGVQSPGLYTLQVTDKNGCVGSDSVLLTGKQCLIGFYIPNAFTPNNNGKNGLFRPLIYGTVVQYKFAVFNRWGQEVFESTQLQQGWDGTVGGALQPAGGYAWYCVYQLQGEKVQMQKGAVLLIR